MYIKSLDGTNKIIQVALTTTSGKIRVKKRDKMFGILSQAHQCDITKIINIIMTKL